LQEKHPQQIIIKVLESQYTPLGHGKIDARDVEGIQTDDPGIFVDPTGYYERDLAIDDFVAYVWFDTQTQMPVWVEFCFTPQGSALSKTIVMDQFQWAMTVDPTLFEFTIPAGFELLGQSALYRACDRASIATVQQDETGRGTGGCAYLERSG
jgi:hypothetical protein